MALHFAAPPPPAVVRYADIGLAFGDSFTHPADPPEAQCHPAVEEGSLRALGAKVTMRNYGVSGSTSADALARVPLVPAVASPNTPALAVIYTGENDPGAGIDQATTTANIVAIGNALVARGYTRLVVGVIHYMNFSSGGDTLAVPGASWTAIRQAQRDAAAALDSNAALADFQNFFRDRIVNGLDVQGDAAWHLADGNVHLNAYGQGLLAACVVAAIQSAGWLPALS